MEDLMRTWGRVTAGGSALMLVAAAMLLMAMDFAATAQSEFPFDREMLLDARPLPGSRRVPILEIGIDGRAQVDLWCRSGGAQVAVAGPSIRFNLGPLRDQ